MIILSGALWTIPKGPVKDLEEFEIGGRINKYEKKKKKNWMERNGIRGAFNKFPDFCIGI